MDSLNIVINYLSNVLFKDQAVYNFSITTFVLYFKIQFKQCYKIYISIFNNYILKLYNYEYYNFLGK